MAIFLSDRERNAFADYCAENRTGSDLYSNLVNRVFKQINTAEHQGRGEENSWWYSTAEYLTDAAMVHALGPSATVDSWLRERVLSIARKPIAAWIGPSFRDHVSDPPIGNLETAHLAWGVAAALDLCPEIFTDAEVAEIRHVLCERSIPLCGRWLEFYNHLSNWRCVLGAGIAVSAAVLNDQSAMKRAVREYQICLQMFQSDGSCGESLQYGNYACYALMLAREALIRRNPDLTCLLPASPWNKMPRWQAASLFYRKPLSGWGNQPRARSANFNDSAALFRPSGDLLLHIAARERDMCPKEAGLARWLFDTLYGSDLSLGPHNRATFGFLNDWGFLSIPLLAAACPPLEPQQIGLSEMEVFSCGDVIARDSWNGRTTIAIHSGSKQLHCAGHLHGDLNSFILVHNRERLLVDPGHSCYRNIIRTLECSSKTHNTCTFQFESKNGLGLQEDNDLNFSLQQSRLARVFFDQNSASRQMPADRGARLLLAAQQDSLRVVSSEASRLYGFPLKTFIRIWILCGSHVLFILDRIVSRRALRVSSHWLFNNRDNALELYRPMPNLTIARRGQAGLQLLHLGQGIADEPENAFVHDAYDPLPASLGEGRPGSGKLLTWTETESKTEHTGVHAIAMDSNTSILDWKLRLRSGSIAVHSPDEHEVWTLSPAHELQSISVEEVCSGRSWKIEGGTNWSLQTKTC